MGENRRWETWTPVRKLLHKFKQELRDRSNGKWKYMVGTYRYMVWEIIAGVEATTLGNKLHVTGRTSRRESEWFAERAVYFPTPPMPHPHPMPGDF